jgi:predicted Abi (CAAX) family protease
MKVAVEIVRSAAVGAHGNILAAFTTYPRPSRLFVALCISMMAAAAVLLPTAMLSGFVQREKRRPRQTLPRGVKLRALAGTLFVPGLLEETVFRAAMLPRLHDNYGDLPSGQCLMLDQSASILKLSRVTLALIVFVGYVRATLVRSVSAAPGRSGRT